MSTNWREARQGFLDTLPFGPSVVLLGAIWGSAAGPAGIGPAAAVFMSMAVYSGAGQFAALPLWGSGGLVLLLGTLVLSLRFALMTASMAPRLARLPAGVRALLAFGITDETYALAVARGGDLAPAYLLGSTAVLYGAWVSGTAAGVLLGARVPPHWAGPLSSVFPIVFLTLVVLTCTSRTLAAVALLGGALGVLGKLWLPGGWHVVLAGVLASLAGPALERYLGPASARPAGPEGRVGA